MTFAEPFTWREIIPLGEIEATTMPPPIGARINTNSAADPPDC